MNPELETPQPSTNITILNISIQKKISLNTITYMSRLTQKKLHKKTNAIFSIYFLILSYAFLSRWGRKEAA